MLTTDPPQTLITAHSEKGRRNEGPTARRRASPTDKRGFGFHPLGSWVDHSPDGTGEPLSMLLREGRAGSNTAADYIAVTKQALAQLPFARRGGRIGRKVLIPADDGGGTHEYLGWLAGQGLSCSVGFTLSDDMVAEQGLWRVRSAAALFVDSAEFLFVAADVGCDRLEGVVELVDLGGQAGDGVGLPRFLAVFFDDCPQFWASVKGGAANPAVFGDVCEGDGVPAAARPETDMPVNPQELQDVRVRVQVGWEVVRCGSNSGPQVCCYVVFEYFARPTLGGGATGIPVAVLRVVELE